MDKILVRHIHNKIAPGGGPSGYLYYLKHAVEEWGRLFPYIHFEIEEVIPPITKHSFVIRLIRRLKREFKKLTNNFNNILLDKYQALFKQAIEKAKNNYSWISKNDALKLFECDLLFVHNVFLAQRLTNLYPHHAETKLLLMTHSPTFLSWEKISSLFPDPDVDQEELYTLPQVCKVVQEELKTMQSVRGVIWPCEASQEGYTYWYELYKAGRVRSIFVETGVPCRIPQTAPSLLRQQWGIQPSQRVILFLGRPHYYRGFDRFVDWADYYRSLGRQDWVFVYGGPQPSSKRDLSLIRYVGYQNDVGAAYLAADLVVFPNRYAFFDLSVLEALALGAKIAVSPVGGYRHLVNICPAIPTIPEGSSEQTWHSLEQIADEYASSTERQEQFKKLWEERFSLKSFYLNHVRAVQSLLPL